jgi:hypothetical protein
MVITMSIISPFTYPSLSLCSHGVITVLCDLQIFPCPTNEDATHVHCVTTLETRTSCKSMTFSTVLHHFEASDVEVTLVIISHSPESPLSYPV